MLVKETQLFVYDNFHVVGAISTLKINGLFLVTFWNLIEKVKRKHMEFHSSHSFRYLLLCFFYLLFMFVL